MSRSTADARSSYQPPLRHVLLVIGSEPEHAGQVEGRLHPADSVGMHHPVNQADRLLGREGQHDHTRRVPHAVRLHHVQDLSLVEHHQSSVLAHPGEGSRDVVGVAVVEPGGADFRLGDGGRWHQLSTSASTDSSSRAADASPEDSDASASPASSASSERRLERASAGQRFKSGSADHYYSAVLLFH